ncbi:endonuclease YncB(thermonuclease family) [Angulomicrobium tetraedrale]|uniref:Endonuclease YncB(Thermonuclease family) n=1 Tax=Ancylobacter tetraedralis TaxID=217068 RepID=A0A839Z8X4_9HYPH|nr:thermonuclease family protein [Ancylobacter tetraedralis]MBB3770057.1 endonuclease YncB(thermonuclease family) [Ancylobacter tetraedralis]
MPRLYRRPRGGWRPSTWHSILFAAALVVVALVVERLVPPLTGSVRVADGDSLEVAGERVRLGGIDAPELHQSCGRAGEIWPCGEKAKAALVALLKGGNVSCRPVDEDRYARAVSVCEVEGQDIAARLVEQGWAVATGLSYRREQSAARNAGRGIWSGPFDLPADWRAAHPRPPS